VSCDVPANMSRQVWRSSDQFRRGPSEHTSQSRHFLFRGKSRGQAHPARQCCCGYGREIERAHKCQSCQSAQRVCPRSPRPQTAGAWRHVCACDANRPRSVHTAYGADATWGTTRYPLPRSQRTRLIKGRMQSRNKARHSVQKTYQYFRTLCMIYPRRIGKFFM
jgi:hypothetical protein